MCVYWPLAACTCIGLLTVCKCIGLLTVCMCIGLLTVCMCVDCMYVYWPDVICFYEITLCG